MSLRQVWQDILKVVRTYVIDLDGDICLSGFPICLAGIYHLIGVSQEDSERDGVNCSQGDMIVFPNGFSHVYIFP